MYQVKDVFYSLQGEGMQAGRPAVFLRFAGCNLWSGVESDRAKAICQFCDTDFVGTDGRLGGKYKTADDLAEVLYDFWLGHMVQLPANKPYLICTGGEPLLQVDSELVLALQSRGFEVAIETNGTLPAIAELDWVTVSPKANAPWQQRRGDELKLVFPQPDLMPDVVAARCDLQFDHWLLQPMDGDDVEENISLAVQYCLDHPQWRLSLQTHKYLNID